MALETDENDNLVPIKETIVKPNRFQITRQVTDLSKYKVSRDAELLHNGCWKQYARVWLYDLFANHVISVDIDVERPTLEDVLTAVGKTTTAKLDPMDFKKISIRRVPKGQLRYTQLIAKDDSSVFAGCVTVVLKHR